MNDKLIYIQVCPKLWSLAKINFKCYHVSQLLVTCHNAFGMCLWRVSNVSYIQHLYINDSLLHLMHLLLPSNFLQGEILIPILSRGNSWLNRFPVIEIVRYEAQHSKFLYFINISHVSVTISSFWDLILFLMMDYFAFK